VAGCQAGLSAQRLCDVAELGEVQFGERVGS